MESHDESVCLFYYSVSPLLIDDPDTFSQERYFEEVNIVLIGKYTDFKDSYMSVIKALEHSAFRVHRKLVIQVCLTI